MATDRSKKDSSKRKFDGQHGQQNVNKKKKRNNSSTTGTGRVPQLDPLQLARGMSSRYLSSRISHSILPLPKDDIEKDLRHMDAYRNACNGYNQQLFVFKNQELVRNGYFGTFAPFPGGSDAAQAASAPQASSISKSSFSMPIKIDPEEEKRLSVLRKKIHQSEFEREQLETEYLSLRAHYVHESQLVRKTRAYEMGRWKILKDLVGCRSQSLALMRLKIALERDIESLIQYRRRKNGINNDAKRPVGTEQVTDLLQIWNDINSQLKEAEAASVKLETPVVLSHIVLTSEQSSSGCDKPRALSPVRGDADKGRVGRKRSSSVASEDESTRNKKTRSPIPPGLEPQVIPWDCMVEPRTPYDVPLLLSCLSLSTDKAVGFVTDKSNASSVSWLDTTLPQSTGKYETDGDDLSKLREEARLLEEELNRQSDHNTDLQKQIRASKSRSDEMAAMTQLIRSETEAVLERHNIVMETPEAKSKSAHLHEKLLEEAKLKNSEGEGDEDNEEEEVEEESSGEDEDEDDDRSDDESVGIKEGLEITVDNKKNSAEEESDDASCSEDGEILEG